MGGGGSTAFFEGLITSSAAAAELGQHNSQLTVSCANLYSSFQKKLASQLAPNRFYGNLNVACSACVCVCVLLKREY